MTVPPLCFDFMLTMGRSNSGAVLIFLPGYDEIVGLRDRILYDDKRFVDHSQRYERRLRTCANPDPGRLPLREQLLIATFQTTLSIYVKTLCMFTCLYCSITICSSILRVSCSRLRKLYMDLENIANMSR